MFSLFIVESVSIFSEFFGGSYSEKNNLNSRMDLSSNNFWVHNCRFAHITYSSSGGSIYMSGSYFIVVEDSEFFNISASSGGSIYSSCTGSVLNRVCGNQIKGSSSAFGYFGADASNKNEAYLLSFARSICPSTTYVAYFIRGNMNFNNLNSSYHHLYHHSGLLIEYSTKSLSKYIALASNFANGHISLCYWSGSDNKMEYSNFYNNSQITASGNIHNGGSAVSELSYYVFLLNTRTYLFAPASGSLKIMNSWSDDYSQSSLFSNTLSMSYTINIHHYSTFYCINPGSILESTSSRTVFQPFLLFYGLIFQ